ncbi:hypothetical protein RvY_10731 [Ramazzottius varieornatus]|uniref:Rho-GAP domain-containing protein n=1 Tax=Ramazzottius varieornatus TaxID=947166 RepID=A0A1D1VDR7_RAMVA|nr:hypothetical protein RvY_10731 [Ramazzottius varieornatus]
MDYPSSGHDTADSLMDDDWSDLVEMRRKINNGWSKLAEETIYTETKFLEFVQHIESDVRVRWNESEEEIKRRQKRERELESTNERSEGLILNIRQQLQSEQAQRDSAESRVGELENVLNVFRDILAGDKTITDEDRQRLYETTNAIRRNQQQTPSNQFRTAIRKSEDIDKDRHERISFDRSDDDLDEEDGDEEMENVAHQNVNVSTRRVVTRTEDGEISKLIRVAERGDGDIEIVAKTHVRIPESGPVEARSSLSTRPRKSVNFTNPISSTLDTRRSRSVPRFQESNFDNPIHRRDEADNMSSDVASVSSEVSESMDSDTRLQVTGVSSARRRSKSMSKALDARPHSFMSKMIVIPEPCTYCKHKITFSKQAMKCTNCHAVCCHRQCAGFLPVPCVPARDDTSSANSTGRWIELEKFSPSQKPRVPAVITQCIRMIEARGFNPSDGEGLYRVPGSDKMVKELKREMYKSPSRTLKPETLHAVGDVHVLCTFLKNILLSLKEPLITYALWPQFSSAAEQSGSQEIYNLIKQLPEPNRHTLAVLMLHLRRVVDHPELRMTAENLQKCMAPSIVGNSRSPETMQGRELYAENIRQQMILAKLFSVSRIYWTSCLDNKEDQAPRTSGDHNEVDHAVTTTSSSTTFSRTQQFYEPLEDSMVMEGGARLRAQNSFTRFFSPLSSASKSKVNANTIRPPPKFQSPAMSD